MASKKRNGHTAAADQPRLPVPVPKPTSRARPHENPPRTATLPARRGAVERRTPETEVSVAIDLDGEGRAHVHTPLPFFNALLELLAKHSLFDLRVDASGDIEAHGHEMVESVGFCVGRALVEALGDRAGLMRFGERTVPGTDVRVRCVVDLGDRPAFVEEGPAASGWAGGFDAQLASAFLRALALEGRMALHVMVERGGHLHPTMESLFTALARALEQATIVDARRTPNLKNE